MPDTTSDKPSVLPAQIEGTFGVSVELFHVGVDIEHDFRTATLELIPQAETIDISSSADGEGFSFDMTPRDALELAKKLEAMCAAYTEDIGACDPCGELFPVEELHDLQTCVGDTTACTRCMESGR